MKQRPLDRSPFEGQWRGDEDKTQMLQYFLMITSDAVTVAQESAGNYVANVMDSAGDITFTVQRVSKQTGRVTSLTAQPSIDNTDPAAATTKSPNAKGFTLVPRTAGRVVLSLLDKLGTARGKLIVNVHATPVTPADPGTGGSGTETPADPGTGGGGTETPADSGTGGSGGTETPADPGTGGSGGTETPADSGTGGSGGTETPADPGTGGSGGTTQPTNPGTGGGTTEPSTPPATPAKKPVLGFKVSVGAAPVKNGDNFDLKVKLALGALTITVTDDIGVSDGDLKFEYASAGVSVAVWSVVPPRSMKLLILGVGVATLTVTHVPTGVKTTLKITITLL